MFLRARECVVFGGFLAQRKIERFLWGGATPIGVRGSHLVDAYYKNGYSTHEEDDMDGSLQSERYECEKECCCRRECWANSSSRSRQRNNRRVDVNKRDDDGTSKRPEDFCCVTSMMI